MRGRNCSCESNRKCKETLKRGVANSVCMTIDTGDANENREGGIKGEARGEEGGAALRGIGEGWRAKRRRKECPRERDGRV